MVSQMCTYLLKGMAVVNNGTSEQKKDLTVLTP